MTILARRLDDELLLLASDGLWDVLSNQEACTLAKRCLRRARQRGASRQSAARIAATVGRSSARCACGARHGRRSCVGIMGALKPWGTCGSGLPDSQMSAT